MASSLRCSQETSSVSFPSGADAVLQTRLRMNPPYWVIAQEPKRLRHFTAHGPMACPSRPASSAMTSGESLVARFLAPLAQGAAPLNSSAPHATNPLRRRDRAGPTRPRFHPSSARQLYAGDRPETPVGPHARAPNRPTPASDAGRAAVRSSGPHSAENARGDSRQRHPAVFGPPAISSPRRVAAIPARPLRPRGDQLRMRGRDTGARARPARVATAHDHIPNNQNRTPHPAHHRDARGAPANRAQHGAEEVANRTAARREGT